MGHPLEIWVGWSARTFVMVTFIVPFKAMEGPARCERYSLAIAIGDHNYRATIGLNPSGHKGLNLVGLSVVAVIIGRIALSSVPMV